MIAARPGVAGRTVIVADDGIATGGTVLAALNVALPAMLTLPVGAWFTEMVLKLSEPPA